MTDARSKRPKRKEAEAVELEPDAWERFEKAVDKVAPPRRGKKPDSRGRKKAFDKIAAGLNDALAIAKGEADPSTYRVHTPKLARKPARR